MGVETKRLNYRDLCCLSISSRRFHRLSSDDALWSTLISFDFPYPSSHINTPPYKSLYKFRFERDRARKLLAHQRAVFNVESQIAVCSKNLEDLRHQLLQENERMKATMADLTNLKKVRQASVALNVWQPEIVRSRQKQIVEQCSIPVEHRKSALEMELKLCKNQIETLKMACSNQKHKLDTCNKRLTFLRYHPMRDYQLDEGAQDRAVKGKKFKQNSDYHVPSEGSCCGPAPVI